MDHVGMLHAHSAGAIDVNDPMSYPHTTPFSYGASHQWTDLETDSHDTQGGIKDCHKNTT